jgi:sigma-B regulation protein RsbU (phosphoserine phosphatase)
MSTRQRASNDKPGVFETIRSDLKSIRSDVGRTGVKETVRQTFADLDHFYLDEGQQLYLARVGAVRRWFWRSWWLLKSLYFRLTPGRRVLLLLSFVAFWVSVQGTAGGSSARVDLSFLGVLLILVVLLLELKDKLLARDELEEGRAVQRALLPNPDPAIPGWDVWLTSIPANDVGGDLVDVMRLDAERYGLTLADVAGKGLGAALLMAKLQATLRALAWEYPDLGDLGGRLNRILCRDGLPNKFATLVHLDVQSDSGRVRLINGGHMPPLLVRGGRSVELQGGGMALGIFDGATFDEQVVEVHRGELLVVYSDGVTEAMNAQEELYGDERLRAVLEALPPMAAREVATRLEADVERFVAGAPRHDDLSLLVLRRTQ